jgi:hypothetical protein
MPKEITHWLIADAVVRRLATAPPNEQQPNDVAFDATFDATFDKTMVRLGATFHDVMYYVPRAKGYEPFFHVADILHGSRGEDTFELVRLVGQDIVKNTDKPSLQAALRSFLLGLVTHICADTLFHPLIYWASGNWHGKNLFAAQREHRILETAIDLYFTASAANLRAIRAFSMPAMLRARHKALRSICRIAARHSYWQAWKPLGRKACAGALWRGYANLAFARRFCHSPLGNALMRRVEQWLPARIQSFTALRYGYEFLESASVLNISAHQSESQTIDYQHPVTGEQHQTSLAELFEASVHESVRLWRRIEADLHAGKTPLAGERGASLELGLVEVPARAMRYFLEREGKKR